jgi:hypothetical protein
MPGLLMVGAVLVVFSAPPLLLMVREMAVGSSVRAQYRVGDWKSSKAEAGSEDESALIGDHRVELIDDQPLRVHEPFKADQDLSAPGKVQIVIDGKPYSQPMAVTIRLMARGANRHWGFIHLSRLFESGGPTRLVVAQRFGNDQYRTISVFADGRIIEDQFDYDARCNPPVRALLIQFVATHPIGFCSDVMTGYPSILFPVLYPFASSVMGLAFVVIGVRRKSSRIQSGGNV